MSRDARAVRQEVPLLGFSDGEPHRRHAGATHPRAARTVVQRCRPRPCIDQDFGRFTQRGTRCGRLHLLLCGCKRGDCESENADGNTESADHGRGLLEAGAGLRHCAQVRAARSTGDRFWSARRLILYMTYARQRSPRCALTTHNISPEPLPCDAAPSPTL